MGNNLVCCSNLDSKNEEERETEPEQTNNDDNIKIRLPNIVDQRFALSRTESQNTILQ